MSGVQIEVPAVPVIGPAAVVTLSIAIVVASRRGQLTARRLLTLVASVVYVAALVTLVFFPLQIATGDHGNRTSLLDKAHLVPVVTIDLRTFVLNVLLFAPVGVLLPLWRSHRTSWTSVAGYSLALSGGIEVLQWLTDVAVSSGRAADVNDLIANVLGALVGFGLATRILGQRHARVVDRWSVARRRTDTAAGSAHGVEPGSRAVCGSHHGEGGARDPAGVGNRSVGEDAEQHRAHE